MNESSRIEAHRRQSAIYTRWRNNERESGYSSDKKAETAYAAFILALWAMKKEESKIPATVEDADRQMEVRLERMLRSRQKKPAAIKDLIEKRYYTEIVRMRDKGTSWRDIAQYAKKYWKLNVSHTHLKSCVGELAAARKIQEVAAASGNT